MTYNKTIKGRFEDLTPDEFVIEMPTGKEEVVLLRGNDDLTEYYMFDKENRYVVSLKHKQTLLLAHLVSDEVGIKYKLPSVQGTYDLLYKGAKKKLFRKMLFFNIPNREVILPKGHHLALYNRLYSEEGRILPDPSLRIFDAYGKKN